MKDRDIRNMVARLLAVLEDPNSETADEKAQLMEDGAAFLAEAQQ